MKTIMNGYGSEKNRFISALTRLQHNCVVLHGKIKVDYTQYNENNTIEWGG